MKNKKTRSLESAEYMARGSFEEDLDRLMRDEEVSRAELARRIGSSSAYISKVLNGTTNYTLQSMVKLANALGALVEIRLPVDGEEVVRTMKIQTAREFDRKHHHFFADGNASNLEPTAQIIDLAQYRNRFRVTHHRPGTTNAYADG